MTPGPLRASVAVLAIGSVACVGTLAYAASSGRGAHAPAKKAAAAAGLSSASTTGARTATRLTVCGRHGLLDGPSSKPPGARAVSPTADLPNLVGRVKAHTTFWLKPGRYTFESGQYNQIVPKDGDQFMGAPGAVIDGRHNNLYAFGQHATGVVISYLTIENFGSVGDNEDEGVVNHDAASGWHISHNTITHDAGAGVMVGSHDVLRLNCLADNGQYGFNAYTPSGPRDVVLNHNEIRGNNTDNWEHRVQDCGCSGGGKFWATDNATIINNYVHGNHGPGIWADTNNRGFDVEGNIFANNADVGLIYEISYNARIAHNTFEHNGVVVGKSNPGFPTSAIYLSESGSNPAVHSKYSRTFQVVDNRFINNWSGVVLWENADRFCNSPDNSSSGDCTLGTPRRATLKTCVAGTIEKAPYFSDCRWKTENVLVAHNRFQFSRSALGAACTVANSCGFNGVFSNYGSDPSWSPYHGTVVERHITYQQNNHFKDNTYVGPWRFLSYTFDPVLNWKQWRHGKSRQDAGSAISVGSS